MSRKAWIILATMALGSAGTVMADEVGNPLLPLCSLSYHSDSYGRGAESVFLGGNRRPRLVDEQCYQLGIQWAHKTAAESGEAAGDCRREFGGGRAQGLEAAQQTDGFGCYGIGYQAGRADLDIGAREGDSALVGQKCVDYYRQGVRDFKEGLANTSPDSDDLKATACYSMGYFDGPLF